MGWPFRKREAPVRVDYTSQRIAEILSRANAPEVDAAAVSAVAIASSLYESAVVAATFTAEGVDFPAWWRALLGRALIERGEFVSVIDVEDGGLDLLPCASWDVTGRARPSEWRYRCDVASPSRTFTRRVPAEGVVHVRLHASASAPWKGRAPWAVASRTSALAGRIETALEREAVLPSGTLTSFQDLTAVQMDQLESRFKTGGHTAVSSGGPASQVSSAPTRFGPAPASAMVSLREQVQGDVLSACGIVRELVQSGQGTNAREVTRRWRTLHLEAVGDRIREELEAKLDREVRLDWNQVETPDSLA